MDSGKAFARVGDKKDLPKVIVRAVMSLYHGTKMKVRANLSEKLSVQIAVHQGSVLSQPLFAIVVDLVTENAREGLMNEILHVDDWVLMSKIKVWRILEKSF